VKRARELGPRILLSLLATVLFSAVGDAQSSQEAPSYKITPLKSRLNST
jgi:hypothetical protein